MDETKKKQHAQEAYKICGIHICYQTYLPRIKNWLIQE